MFGDDDSGMSNVAGMSDGSLVDADLVFRDPMVQREYDRYTQEGVSPAPTRPSTRRDVRHSESLLTVERGCQKDARPRHTHSRAPAATHSQHVSAAPGEYSSTRASNRKSQGEITPTRERATPQKWSSWLSAAANQTACPPHSSPPPLSGGIAAHVQLRGSESGDKS